MTRRTVSQWLQQSQLFLVHRAAETKEKLARDAARDWLKPYLLEHGEEDEDRGHRSLDFADPLEIDGRKYTGLTLQKAVTKSLKVDEALDLLHEKGLTSRVRKLRPAEYYFDWAEIDVLVQEGLLSEEEFDDLLEEDVTWSLRVKEE